jgi:hypothetical protein
MWFLALESSGFRFPVIAHGSRVTGKKVSSLAPETANWPLIIKPLVKHQALVIQIFLKFPTFEPFPPIPVAAILTPAVAKNHLTLGLTRAGA